MRIGLVLPIEQEDAMARAAEEHGLFGVLAGYDDPLASMNAAAYASAHTSVVTIVVRVPLGFEHPITIAEEIAVLDNINNGRTIMLADTADLGPEDASEEIEIIRRSLACRPIRYRGRRFDVPAGIPTNTSAGDSISVTPKPTQIEVPIWLIGDAAQGVAEDQTLPVLAERMSDAATERLVQPALASATGQMETDRDLASSWAVAGATHLLLRLPADGDAEQLLGLVARFIVPEVAVPDYSRVTSEADAPLPWPLSQTGAS